MGTTATLWPQPVETQIQAERDHGRLQIVEGTLQRVNYPRGEFTIVARGRIWAFVLDGDCQLRFDDQPAILRCFHPLDHVRIVYEANPAGDLVAKAIYAWEKARMVS